MSKFHSTLSRRDFMKALGLGAAGLGAVGVASPLIHDLDELTGTSSTTQKRAWWIKEVDQPTVEIDWNVIQRFRKDRYNNFNAHLSQADAAQIQQTAQDTVKQYMTDNSKPGWMLKDRAVKTSMWYGLTPRGRDPNYARYTHEGAIWATTPEQLGVPKYTGSPEDNAKMLTHVLRMFGASTVGFAEINNNTKKLVWSHFPSNPFPEYVFEEVDSPIMDLANKKAVIPNESRWAVVYTNRMSGETFKRPGYTSDGGAGLAYDQCDIVQYRLQSFLRNLGYSCIGQTIQGIGPIAGWGVLTGLGELGRLQHLLTPEWGPMIRESTMNIINMPVAPTIPIDFGGTRFCETACVKCANVCPSAALSATMAPHWEVTPQYDDVQPELFNNPGVKTWKFDHFKCNKYWKETDTYCGFCTSSCVFSKEVAASIHELVKPIVSMTSVFNGFFTNMDERFGYGIKDESEVEKWWDMPLPVHGIDYSNAADPYI